MKKYVKLDIWLIKAPYTYALCMAEGYNDVDLHVIYNTSESKYEIYCDEIDTYVGDDTAYTISLSFCGYIEMSWKFCDHKTAYLSYDHYREVEEDIYSIYDDMYRESARVFNKRKPDDIFLCRYSSEVNREMVTPFTKLCRGYVCAEDASVEDIVRLRDWCNNTRDIYRETYVFFIIPAYMKDCLVIAENCFDCMIMDTAYDEYTDMLYVRLSKSDLYDRFFIQNVVYNMFSGIYDHEYVRVRKTAQGYETVRSVCRNMQDIKDMHKRDQEDSV